MKHQIERLSPHQNGKVFAVLMAVSSLPFLFIAFASAAVCAFLASSLAHRLVRAGWLGGRPWPWGGGLWLGAGVRAGLGARARVPTAGSGYGTGALADRMVLP